MAFVRRRGRDDYRERVWTTDPILSIHFSGDHVSIGIVSSLPAHQDAKAHCVYLRDRVRRIGSSRFWNFYLLIPVQETSKELANSFRVIPALRRAGRTGSDALHYNPQGHYAPVPEGRKRLPMGNKEQGRDFGGFCKVSRGYGPAERTGRMVG